MIPCTDFIPAYSELFKFIEDRSGEQAVRDFWVHLSDTYLTKLRELVAEQGLRGYWAYLTRVLNEEAADFTMELDEEAGEFRNAMHRCPSKGLLLEYKHIQPYHNYCGHCEVMYSRIFESLGFEYKKDLTRCDQARCTLLIRDPRVSRRQNRGEGE